MLIKFDIEIEKLLDWDDKMCEWIKKVESGEIIIENELEKKLRKKKRELKEK